MVAAPYPRFPPAFNLWRNPLPELHFSVRWPDQTVSDCYSPSTIITRHFEVGHSYPLAEFMTRSRTAPGQASERVRARYGYACSSALDQLRVIELSASRFEGTPDACVVVEEFRS